jgi:hypothetical protein
MKQGGRREDGVTKKSITKVMAMKRKMATL